MKRILHVGKEESIVYVVKDKDAFIFKYIDFTDIQDTLTALKIPYRIEKPKNTHDPYIFLYFDEDNKGCL